jgi:hypothetical protein
MIVATILLVAATAQLADADSKTLEPTTAPSAAAALASHPKIPDPPKPPTESDASKTKSDSDDDDSDSDSDSDSDDGDYDDGDDDDDDDDDDAFLGEELGRPKIPDPPKPPTESGASKTKSDSADDSDSNDDDSDDDDSDDDDDDDDDDDALMQVQAKTKSKALQQMRAKWIASSWNAVARIAQSAYNKLSNYNNYVKAFRKLRYHSQRLVSRADQFLASVPGIGYMYNCGKVMASFTQKFHTLVNMRNFRNAMIEDIMKTLNGYRVCIQQFDGGRTDNFIYDLITDNMKGRTFWSRNKYVRLVSDTFIGKGHTIRIGSAHWRMQTDGNFVCYRHGRAYFSFWNHSHGSGGSSDYIFFGPHGSIGTMRHGWPKRGMRTMHRHGISFVTLDSHCNLIVWRFGNSLDDIRRISFNT